MKKIVLSFITFISFFSLSHGIEANIKVGYDFFRYSNIKEYDSSKNETKKIDANYERGFVLGVEILPFTFKDERIKLGVGLEYNFGEKNLKYHRKNISEDNLRFSNLTMMPLYATAKFTYYRPKNIDLNLYTFARLGYAFANEITLRNVNKNNAWVVYNNVSGIYYGLGFGIDYKYFLAEILYDGRYNDTYRVYSMCSYIIPDPSCEFKDDYVHTKDIHHKVGVRLGIQLGSQHFKKPKITSSTKYESNMK